MAGEDGEVVGEGEDALFDFGGEEVVVAAGEVGAADAEVEECVAGDDRPRAGHDEAERARAVAGDVAALDFGFAEVEHLAVVERVDGEVVHVVDRETHDGAVGLGLAQQFLPLGVHRDGEAEGLAGLAEACDVVHVGVGEQDIGRDEAHVGYIACEPLVLVGGLAGGVDDGALPRRRVGDEVGVDLVVVESELLNHIPKNKTTLQRYETFSQFGHFSFSNSKNSCTFAK